MNERDTFSTDHIRIGSDIQEDLYIDKSGLDETLQEEYSKELKDNEHLTKQQKSDMFKVIKVVLIVLVSLAVIGFLGINLIIRHFLDADTQTFKDEYFNTNIPTPVRYSNYDVIWFDMNKDEVYAFMVEQNDKVEADLIMTDAMSFEELSDIPQDMNIEDIFTSTGIDAKELILTKSDIYYMQMSELARGNKIYNHDANYNIDDTYFGDDKGGYHLLNLYDILTGIYTSNYTAIISTPDEVANNESLSDIANLMSLEKSDNVVMLTHSWGTSKINGMLGNWGIDEVILCYNNNKNLKSFILLENQGYCLIYDIHEISDTTKDDFLVLPDNTVDADLTETLDCFDILRLGE